MATALTSWAVHRVTNSRNASALDIVALARAALDRSFRQSQRPLAPVRQAPASCAADTMPERRRAYGPHQPAAGDGPTGMALAQAHQALSLLKHLESPAGHRLPLHAKLLPAEVSDVPL
jgi:hypothetical protein